MEGCEQDECTSREYGEGSGKDGRLTRAAPRPPPRDPLRPRALLLASMVGAKAKLPLSRLGGRPWSGRGRHRPSDCDDGDRSPVACEGGAGRLVGGGRAPIFFPGACAEPPTGEHAHCPGAPRRAPLASSGRLGQPLRSRDPSGGHSQHNSRAVWPSHVTVAQLSPRVTS